MNFLIKFYLIFINLFSFSSCFKLFDENLKNTDPLKWTRFMNNYKHSVENDIFKELIYC